MVTNPLKRAFSNHKDSAKPRGIAFKLTFTEWVNVWKKSGHFHEKGRHRDQYCMARFGDAGAYEVGNVKIITNKENRAEQRVTRRTRLKMRMAKLGRKLSLVHRRKIAKGNTGKKMSAVAIENQSRAKLGKKNPMWGRKFSKQHVARLRAARKRRVFSAETCAKISASHLRRWAEKREREAQKVISI